MDLKSYSLTSFVFLTLSTPSELWQDVDFIAEAFRRFRQRLTKRFSKVCGLWRIQNGEKNGAVHYHLGLFGLSESIPLRSYFNPRSGKTRSVNDEIAVMWTESLGLVAGQVGKTEGDFLGNVVTDFGRVPSGCQQVLQYIAHYSGRAAYGDVPVRPGDSQTRGTSDSESPDGRVPSRLKAQNVNDGHRAWGWIQPSKVLFHEVSYAMGEGIRRPMIRARRVARKLVEKKAYALCMKKARRSSTFISDLLPKYEGHARKEARRRSRFLRRRGPGWSVFLDCDTVSRILEWAFRSKFDDYRSVPF